MKELIVAIFFLILMLGFYLCMNLAFVEAHETTHEQACRLFNGNVTSIQVRIFDGEVDCLEADEGIKEAFAFQDTIGYHLRWLMNMIVFLVMIVGTVFILSAKYILDNHK
jgi:hypothetical protein